MKKKALIVTTTASMIMQFNMSNIQILQELGYDVSTACNFNEGNSISQERVEEFLTELDKMGIIHYCIDFPRSPFKTKRLYCAYKQLKELVSKEQYDLIHCHTPVGGFLTRIVGAELKRKHDTKIFYTAHGFHFYKGAPLKNWLLYFPAEWICSFWTDVLITINKEDYAFAKKHLHARNTKYVPGVGIDIKKFSPNVFSDEERLAARAELGIGPNDKMLLSVGELNHNKNHELVIRAVAQSEDKSLHYIIAGQGELSEYLRKLAVSLGIDDRVKLLGFCNDIRKLYACADLYIHPSLREGLPVALMEAIASKTPVICSKIRGNTDLVEEQALFPCDNEIILADLIRTYVKNIHDIEVSKNYERLKKYDILSIFPKIESLYGGGGITSLRNIYTQQILRESIGVPLDAMLLVSAGELNKNKNHEVVIYALAKLADKDIHYAIAGVGELQNYLMNLAEKLNVAGRIHILGFRNDVAELYRAADIFVFPSIREGFGLAAVEGMASGLPLIISDNRGARDFVNEENGIMFKYNDVDALADGIKTMKDSSEMRHSQGIENMRKSCKFDSAFIARRMRMIYRIAGKSND